jgi:hypothetical protein
MICFSDLKFTNNTLGPRAHYRFQNNLVASVVFDTYPTSWYKNSYECAILDENGLCYSTPITDDVIKGLNEKEVEQFLYFVSILQKTDGKWVFPNQSDYVHFKLVWGFNALVC